MKSRAAVTGTLWMLAWASPLLAQAPAHAQQPAAAQPAASEELAAKREWALERIRGLGGEIAALRDDEAKIRGLARLAAQVCAEDKDMARDFLRKAYALSKPFQKEEPPPPSIARLPASVRAGIGSRPGNAVWTSLVSGAARCDPELAFEFNRKKNEEDSAAFRSYTDLRLATDLAGQNPSKAAEFAQRAMSGYPSEELVLSLVSFLRQLRETDEKQARAVFLNTLQSMAVELRAESTRLLALGNYLFGPPEPGGAPPTALSGWVNLGEVRVLNIMGNRPTATPDLARAYLETSLGILSRPVRDPDLKKLDYAAAYQMRIKAREFAPHLETSFGGLMHQLSGQVPGETPRQSTLLDRPMGAASPHNIVESYGALDPTMRAQLRPLMLTQALQSGNVAQAREVASEVEPAESRAVYLQLCDFTEGMKYAEAGDPWRAGQFLDKIKTQLLRTLLATALANRMAREGQTDAAAAAALSARRDAELVEARLRPPLQLAVAGASASMDIEVALAVLAQAVTGFNRGHGLPATGENFRTTANRSNLPANPHLVFRRGFFIQFQVGRGQTTHRLTAASVEDYDFSPAILRKFGASPERAQAVVFQLTDEVRRAEALAAVAAAYLESIRKAEAANTTVK